MGKQIDWKPILDETALEAGHLYLLYTDATPLAAPEGEGSFNIQRHEVHPSYGDRQGHYYTVQGWTHYARLDAPESDTSQKLEEVTREIIAEIRRRTMGLSFPPKVAQRFREEINYETTKVTAPEPEADELSKFEEAWNDGLDRVILTYPNVLKSFPDISAKARDRIAKVIETLRENRSKPESKRFPAMFTFPTSGRYSVIVKENGDSEVIDEDKGIVIKDRSWEKHDAFGPEIPRDLDSLDRAKIFPEDYAHLNQPEVPEAVKDLMWNESLGPGSKFTFKDVNADILEAYEIGRKSRTEKVNW